MDNLLFRDHIEKLKEENENTQHVIYGYNMTKKKKCKSVG
jgi:hypothetical protein